MEGQNDPENNMPRTTTQKRRAKEKAARKKLRPAFRPQKKNGPVVVTFVCPICTGPHPIYECPEAKR